MYSVRYAPTKEYILLEWTASPFVFRRKHSPNLSPPAMTAVIQTDRYCSILLTEQREVGRALPLEVKRGGCPF